MATIADYIVVRDIPLPLCAGEEKVFEITLPVNVFRGPGGPKPILAYVAEPSNDAADLKYEIRIENKKIKGGSFTGGMIRGLWEAFQFPGNGIEIKISFKVTSGTGKIEFQDIILWFQRVAQL